MIKEAYFRGLMKVAAEPPQQYLQDLYQMQTRDWKPQQSWDQVLQRMRNRLQQQQQTQGWQRRSAQKPVQQQQSVQQQYQQFLQRQPVQRPTTQPAQQPVQQTPQQMKDRALIRGNDTIPGHKLQNHGFYRGTPIAAQYQKSTLNFSPGVYRASKAMDSASKFADRDFDPVWGGLERYYESVGRQNRDFYLKHGHRPPADYQYKTEFPYQNHPKKKQMMQQNPDQVNNSRGQQYRGHA